MIFKHQFKRYLIRAELDTSGEIAILTLEKDPIILDKREGEYHKEALKDGGRQELFEAESGVRADIENGIKEAKEWARDRMTKYRIRKKMKVILPED